MKVLNKSDVAPPDMAPASFTSEFFLTASTITCTSSNSRSNNDVLYIMHSVALAGQNKLETQSMNPDIAELSNVFNTMFKLNIWGITDLDSLSLHI